MGAPISNDEEPEAEDCSAKILRLEHEAAEQSFGFQEYIKTTRARITALEQELAELKQKK